MTSSPQSLLNQFVVAKDFIKMHTMPDHRVYAVKQIETIVEGGVSCYTRHKGFFRDVVSSLAIRHIVLTKTGYLLVWMKPTKGFTLRLSGLADVTTKTSALKYRTGIQQRSLVKIHFPFGTLNLILTNGQIDKWRNALLAGCDRKAAAPVPTPRNALVETATSLAIVPPVPQWVRLPQKCLITSSVVFHRPTYRSIHSIDEWRSDWVDADTITPPSTPKETPSTPKETTPFPSRAVDINLPRSKIFHVSKSTVHPSAPVDTAGPSSVAGCSLPSDGVAVPARERATGGQKGLVVNGVRRSHTTCVQMPVAVTLPIDTGRSSIVDRWLRSQIEKRVRRLDGMPIPPDEIESDAPVSRPRLRSRSADPDMVSLRSKRYSLA